MRGPAVTTTVEPTPYALDRVRWVTIGGIPQAFHVLGSSVNAPVLLFLHGGPGVPHMPFTYVNAELAQSFIVVHWDQRGAGKTFCASPQCIPGSIEDLARDAGNVVEWLCGEFRQDRITLVGHSCGSAIGALVAARFPKRIRAFVGVGQVTDLQSAEFVRYRRVREIAAINRDRALLRRLHHVGPPPYQCASESDELESIAAIATGDCLDPFRDTRFASLATTSRLCTDEELANYALGMRSSQQALWPELVNGLQLAHQVPSFEVPVGLIVGSRDLFAPAVLAEEYLNTVHSRHSKVLCRLDKVGHWPHLQAPRLYRTALTAVLTRCRG